MKLQKVISKKDGENAERQREGRETNRGQRDIDTDRLNKEREKAGSTDIQAEKLRDGRKDKLAYPIYNELNWRD